MALVVVDVVTLDDEVVEPLRTDVVGCDPSDVEGDDFVFAFDVGVVVRGVFVRAVFVRVVVVRARGVVDGLTVEVVVAGVLVVETAVVGAVVPAALVGTDAGRTRMKTTRVEMKISNTTSVERRTWPGLTLRLQRRRLRPRRAV